MEEVSNQEDSHQQEASSLVYRPAGEGLRANEGPDLVSGQAQCPLRASLREEFQKEKGRKEGTQRQRAEERGLLSAESGGQITKDTLTISPHVLRLAL